MKKKYIITFILVIIIFAAFMRFRQNKNTKEINEHTETTKSKMVEMAQKSHTGGLLQMGMYIEKYYKANNKYPENLNELYPDYLNNKPFIEEIDWHYTPKEDNYLLTKTVVIKNRKMVASIDKSLVPRSGSDVMIASVDTIDKMIVSREKERGDSEIQKRKKRRITGIKTEEINMTPILKPKVISVTEGEIGSGISSSISNKYLVWKNEKGNLGFGNREFPIAKKLSTYKDGKWYTLETKLPEKEKFAVEFTKRGIDDLTAELKEQYLVWKDANGYAGFGNVTFPKSKNLSIYDDQEKWVALKQQTIEKKSNEATKPKIKENAIETAISSLENKYLIWKDKNGKIGFGNVLYPKSDELMAYNDDEWVTLNKGTKEAVQTTVTKPVSKEKKVETDQLAAQFSEQYLVWKDRNGYIGFGDLIYPKNERIAVFDNNEWVDQKVSDHNEKIPAVPVIEFGQEKKDNEKLLSILDGKYLIWKDKNGIICYGNIQYPEINELSGVYADGEWRKLNSNNK